MRLAATGDGSFSGEPLAAARDVGLAGLNADDLEDALKRNEIGGVSGIERQSIGGGRGGNEQVREPSAA